MFVYKVMFSKLHECHGILFKLLYSGIDVVMSKGCISLCVSRPQFKSAGLECESIHLKRYFVSTCWLYMMENKLLSEMNKVNY